MKITEIILLHLYKNYQVTLQGLGTFYLDPSFSKLPNVDNPPAFAQNAITFEYSATAPEDPSLVESIVQYTKKLKSLAAADLESFLQWQKELLNMNMASDLGNIGTLQKTVQGTVRFTPYQSPSSKTKPTKSGKTLKTVSSVFQRYRTTKHTYIKKLLPAIIMIAGIMLITWSIYRLARGNKPGNGNSAQKTPAANNITNRVPGGGDKPAEAKNTNNAYVFRVVFLKTKARDEALKTLNEFYGFGHSAIMYSTDSIYKIAMPFNRPFKDTSRIKDSLNKYYSLTKEAFVIE